MTTWEKVAVFMRHWVTVIRGDRDCEVYAWNLMLPVGTALVLYFVVGGLPFWTVPIVALVAYGLIEAVARPVQLAWETATATYEELQICDWDLERVHRRRQEFWNDLIARMKRKGDKLQVSVMHSQFADTERYEESEAA